MFVTVFDRSFATALALIVLIAGWVAASSERNAQKFDSDAASAIELAQAFGAYTCPKCSVKQNEERALEIHDTYERTARSYREERNKALAVMVGLPTLLVAIRLLFRWIRTGSIRRKLSA
ncbi:MAG: hypothetical protein EON58_11285 [Alphaproteobacteria bacterium]|nr:MAG: hypothetical protein EON58_11285 [Alphaproteobacteria bacterium]